VNAAASALWNPFPEWEHRLSAAFTSRGLPPAAPPADPYDRLNLGFRSGGDPATAAANWRAVLSASGLADKPLALPRMIHGDAWADADALPSPTPATAAGFPAWEPDGCDALAASAPGRILAVTMADCLTALIWDPESSTIAAVHAGWRGTRSRILYKVLRGLADAGRLKPASTWIAFGPCLRPQSLGVGPEVAAQLDSRFLIQLAGRTHYDMPGDNRAQALESGIVPERIRDLGGDTLTEPGRYFSYRRDGAASGRHAAFICIR
jgi:copper oxidase (laccase) domain-containing protein